MTVLLLIDWQFGWLIGRLAFWLIGLLIVDSQLNGYWLTDWLIGGFVG